MNNLREDIIRVQSMKRYLALSYHYLALMKILKKTKNNKIVKWLFSNFTSECSHICVFCFFLTIRKCCLQKLCSSFYLCTGSPGI